VTSALGIALAAWLAPAQPPAGEPDPMPCDVAVRSNTLGYREFAEAASFRLPGVRLREATGEADPACSNRLHGYVELRLVDDGVWELTLIASDGRAWFRTVTSEPDQAARSLASALANLLAAIEDASIEPDAHQVEAPIELEPAAPPEPLPPAEPPPPSEPPPSESPPEPKLGPVLLELAPRLSGAVVIGLAPGPGFRGAGGGVGLDLRLPDGLGFGLDVRALRSAAAEVTLVRTRVALGVGWVARYGRFEIPVMISGVVEPWLVRTGRNSTPLGQPPMIGGGLRVAPGVLLPVGSVSLRIGALLGFEIAVEAARGGLTPAIARDPTSDPILRAGGVELAAGLELGVWIPVRERSSK
jgi:hypothetical protein